MTLTEEQVAERLGVSRFTVRGWRTKGMGPAYLKMGRAIRYRVADVEAYIVWRDGRLQEMADASASANSMADASTPPDIMLEADDFRSYEAAVVDALVKDGWQVTHRGWPDFLAIHPDGRIKAVEVKGGQDRLSEYQVRVIDALRRAGLTVEVTKVVRKSCAEDCAVTGADLRETA